MTGASVTDPPAEPDREHGNVQLRLDRRFHPEARVSGFAHQDAETIFFTQVAALHRSDDAVLDFGAGRGEWYEDDPARFRRELQNFRGRSRHLDGCDVDPVVLKNRTLDAAAVIQPGQPLPYEDARFDLVISRYVLEHVRDPEFIAAELLRVTKPGGWICALTTNKWGYVALAARAVPNSLHRAALRLIQPSRKAEDIFPTAYRLNTPGALKRHFGAQAEVYCFRFSGTPTYHFGRSWLYRLQQIVHRFLPPTLDKALGVFIRKR